MKNALFVASISEYYYFKPFVAACKEKDINVYLLDPSRFPKDATLSIKLDADGKLDGYVDVLKCEDDLGAEIRLNIQDIHIAWYLRVPHLLAEDALVETRFARNESAGAIRTLLSVLPCSWINREDHMDFLASNKLYQQIVAKKCGLRIPRTLISNNYSHVIAFSNPQEGLLLKSIGYIKLDEGNRSFLYSERFAHNELESSAIAIRSCPIFSQEYIHKKYEYRVMAIGKHVLACKIDSQASEKTKVDWRHYDLENVTHVSAELPYEIQQKILCFMQAVKLRYGAIDLIETPDGEFVFLEINPSGQWGWIADLANMPIPEAVAEMLLDA
jgi:glutathione synthase/RimK-type ligase-like ATP-grasp enzyme